MEQEFIFIIGLRITSWAAGEWYIEFGPLKKAMYIVKYWISFVCCNSLLLLLWLKSHYSRVANLHIHFRLCSKCGYRKVEFKTYHRYISFNVHNLKWKYLLLQLTHRLLWYSDSIKCIKLLPFDCARSKCLVWMQYHCLFSVLYEVNIWITNKQGPIFRPSAMPQGM